jgi:hypothetical protein
MFTFDSEEPSYDCIGVSYSQESEVFDAVQITYEEQADDPFTRSFDFRSKDKIRKPSLSYTLKTAQKNDSVESVEEELHCFHELLQEKAHQLVQMKREDNCGNQHRIRAELAKLRAENRHYERQNAELRTEIQLSTDSLSVEHQRQLELKEEAAQLKDNYSQLCEMLKELVLQLDGSVEDLEDPRLLVNNIGSSLQLLLSRHKRMATHYEHLVADSRKLTKDLDTLKKQLKLQAVQHIDEVVQLSNQLQAKDLNLQQVKLQLNAIRRQSFKLQRARDNETPPNLACVQADDDKSDTGSECQTKPGSIASSQDTSRKRTRASSEAAKLQPAAPAVVEQVSKLVQRSISPISDKDFLMKLRARTKKRPLNSIPTHNPRA